MRSLCALVFGGLVLSVLVVAGCGKSEPTASSPKFHKTKEQSAIVSAKKAQRYASDQTDWKRIAPIAKVPAAESYDIINENEFVTSIANPKSTFSIDVDTASYSNIRRMINDGYPPPTGAVRIEELVNYFDYQYDEPESEEHPFSIHTDIGQCPWEQNNQLVRIALKGRTMPKRNRPDCNLVFLLDVSGSMSSPRKLPLVKRAMRMLVDNLELKDRIAIAVYAGASGLVLPSTPTSDAEKIFSALESLKAGGSTNGGKGIQLAYQVASKNFIEGGVNRVILCTDGDFNVGMTDRGSLVELIEKKAKSGIELSVLGFGTGNIKDDTMEQLADHGNGNYAYLDSQLEARKALVEQIDSTLITIAKDVKIQVEFNPARVKSYRLIGYENRVMENEDFADDKKDAGEIGAGHTVTALYEIVPAGKDSPNLDDSASEFVETRLKEDAASSDTILKVNLRYKMPEEIESRLFSVTLDRKIDDPLAMPEGDFKFAASVAAYGMLLRNSEHKGEADWPWVLRAAQDSLGQDPKGYRSEFVSLARQAAMLASD